MIYEQFGELKFKYRNREFWCRGYCVDTVGKNKAKTTEYIRHQQVEDKLGAAGKRAFQAHNRNHRLCRWGSIGDFSIIGDFIGDAGKFAHLSHMDFPRRSS